MHSFDLYLDPPASVRRVFRITLGAERGSELYKLGWRQIFQFSKEEVQLRGHGLVTPRCGGRIVVMIVNVAVFAVVVVVIVVVVVVIAVVVVIVVVVIAVVVIVDAFVCL